METILANMVVEEWGTRQPDSCPGFGIPADAASDWSPGEAAACSHGVLGPSLSGAWFSSGLFHPKASFCREVHWEAAPTPRAVTAASRKHPACSETTADGRRPRRGHAEQRLGQGWRRERLQGPRPTQDAPRPSPGEASLAAPLTPSLLPRCRLGPAGPRAWAAANQSTAVTAPEPHHPGERGREAPNHECSRGPLRTTHGHTWEGPGGQEGSAAVVKTDDGCPLHRKDSGTAALGPETLGSSPPLLASVTSPPMCGASTQLITTLIITVCHCHLIAAVIKHSNF
ncbi:hypothetical protein AAY473_025561 [Plecturocebus cupreus]